MSGCDRSYKSVGFMEWYKSRPNSLDSALRRPGRFDREIEIEVPTVDEKRSIIHVRLHHDGDQLGITAIS